MLKLYYRPDPGPYTLGTSLWSEVHPGEGWEETTPETYQEWLASRPPLPPPPPSAPEPDFDAMATALQEENGFKDAMVDALFQNPMATGSLTSRFDNFRKDGNFQPFLQSLMLTLNTLPPQQAAHIGMEFLAVAHRCHMPAAFLEALQSAFDAG